MRSRSLVRFLFAVAPLLLACGGAPSADVPAAESASATETRSAGQAATDDGESMPNVVRVAAGSPDHTTLVKALEAAGLVDALANPGPFTVFAPVNAAFDKLPAGALDDLLKPENKARLKAVLYHHVITSSRALDDFADGEVISMLDGPTETIRKSADGAFIGDARIVASVQASNGMVHVIDAVILPR
jgi:uncharacterized surface protein with fasciclin (FAS1) repeats